MTPLGASKRLNHASSARLLGALGRALDAGLPAATALECVRETAGNGVAAVLARRAGDVAAGGGLARALRRGGLLSGPDAALAQAGEQAGSMPRVLAALAARHERLATRSRRMRARLALPLAVLVIGILVLPLPALVVGDIDTPTYALQTLAALALIAALMILARRAMRAVSQGALPAFTQRLPLLGGMLGEQVRLLTLEQLHALLDAGVPAREAIRICQRFALDGPERRVFKTLTRRLEAGDGLADAMLAAGLVKAGDEHALLSSGEAAGRLEETLERVLASARERLQDRTDTLAEWTPRLVYALAVVALAIGLIG